jgi:hypothetical protein
VREKFLELLRARPFQPFRLELASGSVHVIRHPDQAMLVESLAFIGVPKDDTPGTGPDYADVAIVSLAQVTQFEVLRPAGSAG